MLKDLGCSVLVLLFFLFFCTLFNTAFEDYYLSKDDIMAGIMLGVGYFFGLNDKEEIKV